MSFILTLDGSSLLHRTNKISRVIRVAASFVARHLRIRTQRAGASDRTLRVNPLPLRSDDLVRRRPFFNPAFERDRHVVLRVGLSAGDHGSKTVRAGTAAAMLHTRHHKEPN